MGQLDYALIGNCQVSALLDKEGRYVWSCMPRFDSPALFASLLGDEENGFWDCLPEPGTYETKQRYIRNTNVLLTEVHLKSGERYDIIDFSPRFNHREGYYHAPQLFRILRTVKGTPRVRMRLRPRFDYGKNTPSINLISDGLVYRVADERLFLHSDIPLSYFMEETPFELYGTKYCVLSHGESYDKPLKFSCEEYYDRTTDYWRTWVKHCNIPFEYQEAVIRSALALKLHIFDDTGAIIAATTTSIPESPHGGRNWDYRYCWLRDAYFVINVLNQLGQFDEMEHFIQFLHNIASTEKEVRLQPVYGIGGQRELTEQQLPWLKGFRGLGPVRVGNAAYSQPQHDAYGEMVLAITPIFFDSRLDHLDFNRAFGTVTNLVEKALLYFDEADSGIWEFRGQNRHYLFSKLLVWAAVDRGLKISSRLKRSDAFPHWFQAADRMRNEIQSRGWNQTLKMYTQSYENEDPDASNLLMSAINFHSGQDERFRLTVEQYEKQLMSNGYVFRYRAEDDFGVPCHAFTICTFWLVDALVSLGRREEARALFERVLKCANHVGLLSEDVDPVTGELWGNFPQAYSHVGIINSAFRLSKSWNEAF